MNVKQIKWHAAVFAVTVIAVLTALFALVTVTSNADTSYDPETRTYTMTGGTYNQQINLDPDATTTIDVSGENQLTYTTRCISGKGDLKITGEGTLYIPESYSECNNITIEGGAKLKIGYCGMTVRGNATVDNAEIESENGYMNCGGYYSNPKHVFNNAQLKFARIDGSYGSNGLTLSGESVLTNCNVTTENAALGSINGQLTIDGGTYNCIVSGTMIGSFYSPLYAGYRAVIKNAVIKSNMNLNLQNLEMTDSTLEITVPEVPGGTYYNPSALTGDNLVFTGSKINIDGAGYAGIYANQMVIMTGNTEANVKGIQFGLFGKDIRINHSGGNFQATDSNMAIAAIGGVNGSGNGAEHDFAGTITLNAVEVKEPAGGTVKKVKDPVTGDKQNIIAAVADGETPARSVVLEASHNWNAGKVTKQPTTSEEGVKTYTCGYCGATKTEAIPKLAPQDSQGSQTPAKGEDGTAFGKGASVAAAEAAILALPDDNDPAGTAFGLLQLKASKVTKNSVKLTWKAVPGATKYILFANKCGTGNKYKKLGEVTGTSYTATQAAGAAIQKGTYYKFMMIAADSSGKVISTSKTVHAATKGGKVGNHKKVTVKKSVTKKAKKLKKGKTLKLKAKAVPQAKKLKVRKHRGIMYESSNPAVAQVNGKGTVKGIGKGTCYIYAYAQNGTCAKVKVTVK